jgi:hypothetical protein
MWKDPHGYDGFWYRYDVEHFAVLDPYNEDVVGSSTHIIWRKFAVIKQTPKGVWLTETSLGDTDPDRWIGMSTKGHFFGPWLVRGKSKKQFACPTRETAWQDCVARKKRHIEGCQARLNRAKSDLNHLMMCEPRKQKEPEYELR